MATSWESNIPRHDGEQAKALRILEELKQTNKGAKITQEIESAILDAQKSTKNYRATKFNIYLAKHLQSTSKSHKINTTFLPDIETINAQSRVKALIFKEALNALPDNPETSLTLLNAILAFSQGRRCASAQGGSAHRP